MDFRFIYIYIFRVGEFLIFLVFFEWRNVSAFLTEPVLVRTLVLHIVNTLTGIGRLESLFAMTILSYRVIFLFLCLHLCC